MQPHRAFVRIPLSLRHLYLVLVVYFAILASAYSANLKVQCQACKDFVQTFWQGHEKTSKSNFGGGNTDWEETRLGSYATSETRLVEILEHSCTSGLDKDQCHQFVEHNEEPIEKWYFHLQKTYPNFERWLCVDNTIVCCQPNTFGPKCEPCPGSVENPCTGRGTCEGNGTRAGSGKCKCHKGYSGEKCYLCESGYEIAEQNETFISCEDVNECEDDPLICSLQTEYCMNTEGSHMCYKCHPACKGGCTGAGAGRCKNCADGYVLVNGTCIDEEHALEDDDEPLSDNKPPTASFRAVDSLPTDKRSEL